MRIWIQSSYNLCTFQEVFLKISLRERILEPVAAADFLVKVSGLISVSASVLS
jgi:hypothetical protein